MDFKPKAYPAIYPLTPICALDGEILYSNLVNEVEEIIKHYSLNYRGASEILEKVDSKFSYGFTQFASREYVGSDNQAVNEVVTALLQQPISRAIVTGILQQVYYNLVSRMVEQPLD
ncbi:hypothetical protein JQN58_05495 [Aneurinibacillus sp. BA2021]|nr:hypothetical protein [Aneurinibacillus sp. BA2021]